MRLVVRLNNRYAFWSTLATGITSYSMELEDFVLYVLNLSLMTEQELTLALAVAEKFGTSDSDRSPGDLLMEHNKVHGMNMDMRAFIRRYFTPSNDEESDIQLDSDAS